MGWDGNHGIHGIHKIGWDGKLGWVGISWSSFSPKLCRGGFVVDVGVFLLLFLFLFLLKLFFCTPEEMEGEGVWEMCTAVSAGVW